MKDEIDMAVVEQVEAVHRITTPLSEVLLLFSEMASKIDEQVL